jgi:hypothetical protein
MFVANGLGPGGNEAKATSRSSFTCLGSNVYSAPSVDCGHGPAVVGMTGRLRSPKSFREYHEWGRSVGGPCKTRAQFE